MYIIKKLDQYHENYIYFCEPIKNNIMTEGIFTRILYSNSNIIFNGIYLEIPLVDIYFEKYYNKYKCCFNMILSHNKEIIDRIRTIEETILHKYNATNKIPHFKIFDHIRNGNIKIFCDVAPKNTTILVLKISGIWETQSSYGLTYKFINFNQSVL